MLGGFNLVQVVQWLVILIIAIAIHEFAHAWTAFKLGDSTPYYQGRVTLNPIAHLDPIGTLFMVLMVVSRFPLGWGKPVMVNPYNLKYGPYKGNGIVAAAGPLSNILQAVVAAIPLRLANAGVLPIPDAAFSLLGSYITINILLAVFNLIPLPPLDGSSVLQGILDWVGGRSTSGAIYAIDRLKMAGFMPLLLLLLINYQFPILSIIMGPPINILQRLIVG